MARKAQVTLFIILGLILLLSTGIFIYYASTSKEAELSLIPDEIDKSSFISYVESCLDATTENVLALMERQGAMYEPMYYKLWYGNKIAYWCYGEGTNQCVNTLFTKKDAADQIIYGVKQEITNCLDFVGFEAQGYELSAGVLSGTAVIAENNIDLSIKYPIRLTKGEQQIIVQDFHSSLKHPLGHLMTVAEYIINEEATKGAFNAQEWQLSHTGIIIQKQKPYPTTIYTLTKEGTSLSFAVQGIDTVANLGEIIVTETNYGCCYIDNICYANTPSTQCATKTGTYETAPCSCEEPEVITKVIKEETACSGDSCDSCGSYKHGESWCVYDEDVDAPGSRHNVYSCFDGTIYDELCRDYREEICVQTDIGAKTKAICRINRWQDCNACTTEECCIETTQRDCYWDDNLAEAETQCIPAVSPGAKFWKYNGVEICARANEEKTCSGLHCSQSWIDATALSCSSQADCGNDANIVGQLTEHGFINSDMKYDPSEESQIGKNNDAKKMLLKNLPLTIIPQKKIFNAPVGQAVDVFLYMVTTAYKFIDQWAGITIPNYLNPFTPSPKIEILDVAICLPWQAPNIGSSCDQCDNEHECSEYKCKSLGKKCVYEEREGFPTCSEVTKEEQKPFIAEIDKETMPDSYSITNSTLAIDDQTYYGYKVNPELVPYRPFTIGIKTTEESICRIDYTPNAEFFDAPLLMMGSSTYEKHHNITIRVPPKVTIPQKMKDALNLSTAKDIVNAIIKPKDLLENYQENFPAVFTAYSIATGESLEDEINPYVDKMLRFIEEIEEDYSFYENLSITLLDKFDHGGYYLFVSCEDKYGDAQREELFIEVDIAEKTEDASAPQILKMIPEHNDYVGQDVILTAVSIYTDEPATCRYATENKTYDEMEHSFSCNNNQYDLVSIAGGSYECTTTLETINDTTIYFACADHPNNKQTYLLSVQGSETIGIDGELYSESLPDNTQNILDEYSDYIYISPDININKTTIGVSSYLLSEDHATVFNITTGNATIKLFMENENTCMINNGTITKDMDCTRTDMEKQHVGSIVCRTEISIDPLYEHINLTKDTNMTENMNVTEETNTSTKKYAKQEFNINCIDGSQTNINRPMQYTIKKSSDLAIVGISPANNEEVKKDTAMTVTTSLSEDISCGYAERGTIEFLQLRRVADTIFTTVLYDLVNGYNTYVIHCKDAYGNTAEQTVSFYVV